MKVDQVGVAKMNVEDAEWADKLVRVLEEFRKLNQNITVNTVVLFLQIAMREGVSQKELEKVTGLDNGTVSRICAILSDRGLKSRGAEPMNLIRIGLSDTDYRARAQSLSPNGKRVFNSLRTIMKGR